MIQYRQIKNNVFTGIIIFFSVLSVIPLLFILGYLISQGLSSINLAFFWQTPRPLGEMGGGIANALLGSLLLILIASICALPIGIAAGIYLAEKKDSKLAEWVRLCVEILQGIPSIVIGVVAYAWLVLPFKTFSAVSGGLALALMMLPIIVRTTEETLKMIPGSLKEASLALGVPYYRTILRVILPAGSSGIVTGVLLSVSRIAGETAPLLFTAFGSPYISTALNKPIESLPHLIYYYATSPYDEWHRLAWGASFVLVLLVLSLNVIAKVVMRKWKVQF
jgi:phosphate transport system permease protein